MVVRTLVVRYRLEKLSHIERECVLRLVPRFEALCNLWARGYPTYPPDVSRTIVNKVAFFIDRSWLSTRPKKWFCRIKVPLDIQVRIGNERDRGAPIFIDLKKRELRLRRFIPRKAIVLKLDKSHVKYIIERLRESARAKCGFVWIEDRYLCVSIVFEREEPRPYTPESILIIDINSWKHGIMTALVKDGRICSIRRYRPDLHRIETWYNKTLLLEKELGKLKRLGLKHTIKARRVRLEAKNLRRKIYAYLRDYCNKTIHWIIKRVLKNKAKIIIDDIAETSIRQLREELLDDGLVKIYLAYLRRFVKLLENQARWYGVPIEKKRLPSKICPYCHTQLVENGYRRLKCPKCEQEYDRDLVPILHVLSTGTSSIACFPS